jgi:hypothetical protein
VARKLTRLSNANSDVAAHEGGLCKGKCFLQAVDCGEFNITEALGLHVKLILNDANVGDLTPAKEGLNVGLGDIEGEVTEMGSVWGLIGHRKFLACGERTVCRELARSSRDIRDLWSLTKASNTLSTAAGTTADAASGALPGGGGHSPALFSAVAASSSLGIPSTVSRAGCGQRLCVHLVGP